MLLSKESISPWLEERENSTNSTTVVFSEQNNISNSKTISKSLLPCNRPHLCLLFLPSLLLFFVVVFSKYRSAVAEGFSRRQPAGSGLPALSPAMSRVPALIRLHRRLCSFAPLSRECVKGSRPVFILPCAPSECAPNPAAWHPPTDSCRGAGNARFYFYFFCGARAGGKASSSSRQATVFVFNVLLLFLLCCCLILRETRD